MPRELRPLPSAASSPALARRLALLASLVAGATLIAGAMAVSTAQAKSPGARYCFNGFCHRVGTLAQTDTLVGWRGYVLASYYDSCRLDRLNPCGLTSSGAVFRPDLPDNAASPLLPDGTVILAYNPDTGDASVLRVTNAGPYSGQRKLDVSRAAADKLGFRQQGVAALVISVLQSPTQVEASYARKRVYAAVPGYIGKFDSVDIALSAAQERFDVRQEDEPIDNESDGLETAALGNSPLGTTRAPRPQLAVSPSLARELVMLRTPPKPVSRGVRLVEGPRLVSRSDFEAERDLAPTAGTMDFTSGWQRYLLEPSDTDGGR